MDLLAAVITDLAQTGLLFYLAYRRFTEKPATPDVDAPSEEAKMIAKAIVTHHVRGGGRERLRLAHERFQARRAAREAGK